MLAASIVFTALLLASLGLRAERRRASIELWTCNAAAAALLVATIAGHASGRIA